MVDLGSRQNHNLTRADLRHARQCCGVTLLELLVATALSVLVVASALLVWQAIVKSAATQSSLRETAFPAEASVRMLTHDLTCALAPFAGVSNVMTLSSEPVSGSTQMFADLAFYTATLQSTANEPRAFVVNFVRYGVAPSQQKHDSLALVRQCVPVFPAGEPQQEECVHNVRQFDLLLACAETWTNALHTTAAEGLPQKARVRLAVWRAEKEYVVETTTVIPAGLRIEPAPVTAGDDQAVDVR